jgi:hypothetical protein
VGTPADAVREFMHALIDMSIAAKPRHVKDDIVELRRAFPKDEDFSRALRAVTHHLRRLRPEEGNALDYDLRGWRRVKFPSGVTDYADLRLIFRPLKNGFELRAFGQRHDPESVYRRATTRGG